MVAVHGSSICLFVQSGLNMYLLLLWVFLNWKCKGPEPVRFCIQTHSQYILDSCLAAQISDIVMA